MRVIQAGANLFVNDLFRSLTIASDQSNSSVALRGAPRRRWPAEADLATPETKTSVAARDATLAAVYPARRAAGVNPVTALRHE
jgi:hypothetical protein